jgi:ABC-type amino acid transport substrate-binding protein
MAFLFPILTFIVIFMFLIYAEPGRRIWHWLLSLGKSGVEPGTAKFSDFVTFTGFGLTVAGVFLSWYTVNLQTRKANLEAQIKDFSESNSTQQQKLRDVAVRRQGEFAHNVDLHLEFPTNNVSVIKASFPDLQWRYSGHNDRINYLIELVRIGSESLQESNEIVTSCNFDQYRSCLFYATDPNAQQSKVNVVSMSGGTLEGSFLWRVIPAKSPNSSSDKMVDFISEWSEFASFSVYSSLFQRLKTRAVLVGTSFSDNEHFSTVDSRGRPSGHDIDLIRLLVEGCISISEEGDEIRYDAPKCYASAAAYRDAGQLPPANNKKNSLRVAIKPFPSLDVGLAALTRKEIDLFIGSITKATERENETILFTDGYCKFRTAVYAHALEGETNLNQWARSNRKIGVIQNTTNHWLATALTSEEPFQTKLSIVAFPSFASLKTAFERHTVDGVLVDNILGKLHEWKELDGLDQTTAWTKYHERIGFEAEQFAIAVSNDGHRSKETVNHRLRSYFRQLFNMRDTSEDSDSIYDPLQHALESVAIQETLPTLRQRNGLASQDLQVGRAPGKP